MRTLENWLAATLAMMALLACASAHAQDETCVPQPGLQGEEECIVIVITGW